MGQRLVVEIYNGDKRLANAYYHWSGYTGSSYEITQEIVNEYYNLKNKAFFLDKEKNEIYKAIKLLEVTGSGVSEVEMEEFHKLFPGNDNLPACNGRNNGITSFTKKGMDNSFAWNEALVTIQLKDETLSFDALYSSSYNEWFDDHSERSFLDFDDFNGDEKEKEKVKDISRKKIEEWAKEGLITESSKATYLDWVSEEKYYFSEEEEKKNEPLELEEHLNFSCIHFEDLPKLGEIIDKSYSNNYSDFYFKYEPDTIYIPIA